MKYYHYYESPIGKLVIVHNDRGITNLYLAHLLQIEIYLLNSSSVSIPRFKRTVEKTYPILNCFENSLILSGSS